MPKHPVHIRIWPNLTPFPKFHITNTTLFAPSVVSTPRSINPLPLPLLYIHLPILPLSVRLLRGVQDMCHTAPPGDRRAPRTLQIQQPASNSLTPTPIQARSGTHGNRRCGARRCSRVRRTRCPTLRCASWSAERIGRERLAHVLIHGRGGGEGARPQRWGRRTRSRRCDTFGAVERRTRVWWPACGIADIGTGMSACKIRCRSGLAHVTNRGKRMGCGDGCDARGSVLDNGHRWTLKVVWRSGKGGWAIADGVIATWGECEVWWHRRTVDRVSIGSVLS